MKTRIWLSAALGFASLSAVSQAEVVTGEYSHDTFRQNSEMVGIDIGVVGSGWTHNGRDYWELDLRHFMDSGENAAVFLAGGEGGAYFGMGETISSANAIDATVQMGNSEFWQGETYYNFIGEVGESIFLGFRFTNRVADPSGSIQNYGFLQMNKISESSFEIIGYAYETEHEVGIEAYDLVPAPSGIAVLGFAGLAATRRRRA